LTGCCLARGPLVCCERIFFCPRKERIRNLGGIFCTVSCPPTAGSVSPEKLPMVHNNSSMGCIPGCAPDNSFVQLAPRMGNEWGVPRRSTPNACCCHSPRPSKVTESAKCTPTIAPRLAGCRVIRRINFRGVYPSEWSLNLYR